MKISAIITLFIEEKIILKFLKKIGAKDNFSSTYCII